MVAARSRQAGFSLVETLAALAIAAVIILGTGKLLHRSVFFFDKGTDTVDQAEELDLAIESLTRDFASARFVLEKAPKGARAAFTATPGQILFVTGGGRAAGPMGEEIVGLSVEEADGLTQLVRRRLAWPGPHMLLEEAGLQDPVVLLKGKLDIAFSFSERAPDQKLVWHKDWSGEKGLPHSVRLTLLDSQTGDALMEPVEFPVYANAPADCAGGKVGCLSLAQRKEARPRAVSSTPVSVQSGASP